MRTITSDEFEQLPSRASVALAARAARRTLPLVEAEWSDSHPKLVDAASEAIRAAELFTIVKTPIGDFREAWVDAAYAVHSSKQGSKRARAGVLIAHGAIAAANHLYSDLFKSKKSRSGNPERRTLARVCVRQAIALSESIFPETVEPIRADFYSLRSLTSGVDDDSAIVPVEAFGPLWPSGAPAGWFGMLVGC